MIMNLFTNWNQNNVILYTFWKMKNWKDLQGAPKAQRLLFNFAERCRKKTLRVSFTDKNKIVVFFSQYLHTH
jgi:hypothetical protein